MSIILWNARVEHEAWTDPSSMSEPVLAIGDMKGDECPAVELLKASFWKKKRNT